ncbi:hybrid sensor histidine kinase/response regulator [Hahella sp. SMD15-11]|uniref:histidine kinase n=1 Tax=Thermohahella caldifontis TaxID=3142973 RepID=A0AB39UUV5_9GAMM
MGRRLMAGWLVWLMLGGMVAGVFWGVRQAEVLRDHWVGQILRTPAEALGATLSDAVLPVAGLREQDVRTGAVRVIQRLPDPVDAPDWAGPVGDWLIRGLPVERRLGETGVLAWQWHSGMAAGLWWQAVLPGLQSLLFVLIWALAGMLLAYHLCIQRRLARLTGFLNRVDYRQPARSLAPYRSALSAQDELDALAIGINHVLIAMQTSLDRRQEVEAELRESRRTLEKRVEARTREITELNKKFVRQQFEAKMAALEARQARWEAEKANQDKTRFLAAASHDLRQPLHAMNLLLEALRPHVEGERGRQIFANLERSLDTMKQLFNALLDISKLEAGVMKPERSHFCLDRLFDRLEVLYRQEADEKGLDLRIVRNRYHVYSDPRMLEQVLVNLVGNAIKYTQSGWVLVGVRYARSHVRLVVWDSGIGIPAEAQSQVFKEFVQLHNPERDRSKGLGLGLAIVNRTCQLLGHSLRLTSREGWGTRFEVAIPLGDKPRRTEPVVAVPHSLVRPGQRVLVVDDDPAILVGMKALLESWGLEPMLAKTLEEALTFCRQTRFPPRLIISDFRLAPDLTGIDAIREIQKVIGQQVPGLLITGDTDPDRIRLAASSPYPLLHKPIRPAHLRAVCMGALQGADARQIRG